MKTIKLSFCLLVALLSPRFALADIVGNYTADANTLFLLHFSEAAGGTFTTNNGSKAGKFYCVTEATASATPATVTTMLGAAGYVNGPTNFGTCMTNPTTGYEIGYDYNNSGAYQGEGTAPCPDAIQMTNLNIGFGGNTSFTLEALIRPTQISSATGQEIICTDSSSGNRGFQFRIISSTLAFQFITGGQSMSGAIPTTGNDAFVAGNWYHVAITYNGSTATLYWTLLNPTNGAAHVLSTASLNLPASDGAVTGPLIIGNENRAAAGEQFLGSIDEVRISSVARGSGQMQFYSPLVTITQNPVSQNVDYNQPVTFSVGASSQFALGYQWRFNSNSIAGATNTFYVITNVAASNAGYYDCIVTNTIAISSTSSEAQLVVGAANFIANRYSFTTSSTDPNSGLLVTPDSIGGQTGTNFGNATVTGGALVLDGTSGTYMQLPPGLFNGQNATALTVEFWATYGTNPNNVYTFAFGVTNFVINQGIVGFNHTMYTSHNAGGQTASGAPGDPQFAQTVNAAGNLDGKTVHVAVVFDPPNKLLSIYTNGVLEAVNTNFTVNISSMNDQLSFIGRSLWPVDPYLTASIDEIRIFKGALSSITIKQSQDQGPNTLLADGPAQFTIQPTNTSTAATLPATFTAAAVGYLPINYQWFKNGALVPGETNSTYTFIASSGDNNASVVCYATNTIGVTTYVTNSSTATLTVFVPPTLTWADWNNNIWDTVTPNWDNSPTNGSQLVYAPLDRAIFNGSDANNGGSGTVDMAEAVNPLSITVDTFTENYTFISSGLNGSLAGGGSLTKNSNGTLIIDVGNNMAGPVTVYGGTLQVGAGDALGSLGSGVVTNNATLSLNRSDTALNVANTIHGTGTLSVDGAGTVTVSGNSDFTGPTLVNQGILILQNANALGASSGAVTVSAANNAELYITANVDIAAKPLVLGGAGVSGAGALRKGGAGVSAYYGTVTLTADTSLSVDGGATLNLTNSAGIDGVTVPGSANLTLMGTGVGNIAGPVSLGSGKLIAVGGTWTVAPSNNFSGQTVVGGGQLKITGPLSFGPSPGSFTYNQVLLNGGTLGCATNVTLNDGNIGFDLSASSSISVDANQTLTISNQISTDSGSFSLTKTGAGKLILNGANTFSGTLNIDTAQGSTGNDGTLVIANNAAIFNLLVQTGVPEIQIRNQNAATSTLQLDGTTGAITIAPDIALNGRNNTVPAIESVVGNNVISGNFTLGAGGGTYTIQSDAGTLALSAPLPYVTPTSGRTFTFAGAGVITASGGIQDGTSGAVISVIKNGTGTLNLPVANVYSGSTVINNGVLMLNGSITSTGAVLVASGAAATLSGTGTITDNVIVQTGGTVSPGAGTNSVGVLTINGNLTNSGTLLIDLNKSGSLLTNDTIIGIGTLQYGGALQLVLSGNALTAGNSFTLFSAGAYTGAFTNIVPSAPAPGLAWDTSALGTSGVLSVVTGPSLLVQAAPVASNITNGQTLAASILTGGSVTNSLGASVPGTFAFTTPSTMPGVGTASQSVTFTPTDTATYNPITLNVSVTVVAASAPPVAGFSGTPVNGFAPLGVTFTDASTGSITNWVWVFGDGTSVTNSSNANQGHTYAVGTNTVSLIANGPGGSSTNTRAGYIVAVSAKVVFGSSSRPGSFGSGKLGFSGTGGPAGVQYRVLTQTNITQPIANWTPIYTNTFNSDGSYGYTNSTLAGNQGYLIMVSP